MKSLITTLSVLTLVTTVGNLGSNLHTHQKTEAINTIIKKDIKKVNNNINLFTIFAENNISNLPTQKNIATHAGGENYYKYYFAYYTIGLNHDTLRLVNNAISSGIGAVAAILSLACSSIGNQ